MRSTHELSVHGVSATKLGSARTVTYVGSGALQISPGPSAGAGSGALVGSASKPPTQLGAPRSPAPRDKSKKGEQMRRKRPCERAAKILDDMAVQDTAESGS